MYSVLNVNYHILHCQAAVQPGVKVFKKDGDFLVDCRELELLLNLILERKEAGQDYQSPLDIRVEKLLANPTPGI